MKPPAFAGGVVTYLNDAHTHRLIPSQSKPGAFYVVALDSCSCADSQYRPNKICKHRIALKLQQVLADAEQQNAEQTLKVVA